SPIAGCYPSSICTYFSAGIVLAIVSRLSSTCCAVTRGPKQYQEHQPVGGMSAVRLKPDTTGVSTVRLKPDTTDVSVAVVSVVSGFSRTCGEPLNSNGG